WWQRTALAWALQSPALARRETDGLVLLWRRDVPERLGRLAPFASFADAVRVVADSALWWVAYGYFEGDGFPLARPVVVAAGDSLRYLRAGLLGTVNAANGDTRDRKSTRLNSSHQIISYAVFCLKKKKHRHKHQNNAHNR